MARKCLAGIVITARVHIAKAQRIVGVDIGIRNGTMCLFEQWNRLGGLPRTKQAYALHLHGFEILWILGNRFGERCRGFDHLALLVEHHASEIFDTRRFGLFRSQGIQLPQSFI